MTLKDKAKQLGIKYHTLFYRLRQGWSEEQAFTLPAKLGNNIDYSKRGANG